MRTPAKCEVIRSAVSNTPSTSSRQVAQQVRLPHPSTYRVIGFLTFETPCILISRAIQFLCTWLDSVYNKLVSSVNNVLFSNTTCLFVNRSVGTFARALDCSSSVKQPSLHMSAAAASRDITLVSCFAPQKTLLSTCLRSYPTLSILESDIGPVFF